MIERSSFGRLFGSDRSLSGLGGGVSVLMGGYLVMLNRLGYTAGSCNGKRIVALGQCRYSKDKVYEAVYSSQANFEIRYTS